MDKTTEELLGINFQNVGDVAYNITHDFNLTDANGVTYGIVKRTTETYTFPCDIETTTELNVDTLNAISDYVVQELRYRELVLKIGITMVVDINFINPLTNDTETITLSVPI